MYVYRLIYIYMEIYMLGMYIKKVELFFNTSKVQLSIGN